MRLIDADELLKKFCHGCPDNDNGDNCIMNHCADYDLVVTMPTIELVRCKDCKWYTPYRNIQGGEMDEGECEGYDPCVPANHFCSRGERKDKVEE